MKFTNRAALVAWLMVATTKVVADSSLLWSGGLWNIDYPGDISTYGYYRLWIEPDKRFEGDHILRVEWIERLGENGDRLFGSILVPELVGFLKGENLQVTAGESPSRVQLSIKEGKSVWLVLEGPAHYSIEEGRASVQP